MQFEEDGNSLEDPSLQLTQSEGMTSLWRALAISWCIFTRSLLEGEPPSTIQKPDGLLVHSDSDLIEAKLGEDTGYGKGLAVLS